MTFRELANAITRNWEYDGEQYVIDLDAADTIAHVWSETDGRAIALVPDLLKLVDELANALIKEGHIPNGWTCKQDCEACALLARVAILEQRNET